VPLMLCGEWPPPALRPRGNRGPRGRLQSGARPASSLVAKAPAPLSPGGCSDIEVLRCLSASSVRADKRLEIAQRV
jgi:hypothetical protein